ncbi:MAG TPA: peptidase domain-containing ABC transporter [Ktedonobacteraceae bacterium]|jgi:ATP-binding cassette subfamily B protein|nr:peptidase domain-containing ABC transporter [Ktedonobacteraceae bacterium]
MSETFQQPSPPSSYKDPHTQGSTPAQGSAPTKKRRFGSLFRRRVTPLMQMSEVECGAACLAMMLQYYGRKTSVAEISDRYGVGRDGLSALSITTAARQSGLRVRAISLRENDFRFVQLPAIVHWEFNHFLIVERWTPKSVEVVDPAVGRHTISGEEFNRGFTGIVLMMEPGAQFERKSTRNRVNLWSYARAYIQRAPQILFQVLIVTLLLQLLGLGLPLLTAIVVDQIIPSGTTSLLTILGIGMIFVLLAELIIQILRTLLLIYLQNRVDTYMVPSFMEHLLQLPLKYFQQRSSGDMLTRISSNLTIREIVGTQFISAILDGGTVILYLIILLQQNIQFGLVALGIGLVQALLLFVSRRQMLQLSNRELETIGREQGYTAEMLNGVTTIKAMGFEQRAFQQWANFFSKQLNATLSRTYLSSLISTAMTTMSTLSPILLLWIGAIQVLHGQMQVGTMIALSTLATAFLTPLASLVSSGTEIQIVNSHLARIADVLDAEPEQEIQDSELVQHLHGQIRMERVSFRYDAQTPNVLEDISLNIEPGQKIAIVGQTGSGKSTLGKLMLGLYQPSEGEIFFDGTPLQKLNYQSLRAHCGVVMQDSSIFSGSIKQNITFQDSEIGLKRVEQAARLAALHEDISEMPMGYETFVGEGGNSLSGGQRQRLALARALAHAPSILLLDEATSALDVVTERQVEQNLRQLGCTQIIIAHRLSTIRQADLILVLDQGHIIERGTHQELLEQDGYYAYLIRNQLVQPTGQR